MPSCHVQSFGLGTPTECPLLQTSQQPQLSQHLSQALHACGSVKNVLPSMTSDHPHEAGHFVDSWSYTTDVRTGPEALAGREHTSLQPLKTFKTQGNLGEMPCTKLGVGSVISALVHLFRLQVPRVEFALSVLPPISARVKEHNSLPSLSVPNHLSLAEGIA